jgi:hypothetical protein
MGGTISFNSYDYGDSAFYSGTDAVLGRAHGGRQRRPRQVKDAHGVRAAAGPAAGRSLRRPARQADRLPWDLWRGLS